MNENEEKSNELRDVIVLEDTAKKDDGLESILLLKNEIMDYFDKFCEIQLENIKMFYQ